MNKAAPPSPDLSDFTLQPFSSVNKLVYQVQNADGNEVLFVTLQWQAFVHSGTRESGKNNQRLCISGQWWPCKCLGPKLLVSILFFFWLCVCNRGKPCYCAQCGKQDYTVCNEKESETRSIDECSNGCNLSGQYVVSYETKAWIRGP